MATESAPPPMRTPFLEGSAAGVPSRPWLRWFDRQFRQSAVQPYIVVWSLSGSQPDGTTYLVVVFDRTVTFAGDFVGSVGHCLTNPSTSSAQYTVKKNGTTIGTITLSTAGVFTFATTSGLVQTFAAGDYLTIVTPSPANAALADVAFELVGTR